MLSFFFCLALLIGGYFLQGKRLQAAFSPDDRATPAVTMTDGADYVVMPMWRIFLIQLLNIAGIGPIWGAVSGALWGPSVLLWITFGTIFAGIVHDFSSGFLSMRNQGLSISELSGLYIGETVKKLLRAVSLFLLFFIGVTFSAGPAGLLSYLFMSCGAPSLLQNKFSGWESYSSTTLSRRFFLLTKSSGKSIRFSASVF